MDNKEFSWDIHLTKDDLKKIYHPKAKGWKQHLKAISQYFLAPIIAGIITTLHVYGVSAENAKYIPAILFLFCCWYICVIWIATKITQKRSATYNDVMKDMHYTFSFNSAFFEVEDDNSITTRSWKACYVLDEDEGYFSIWTSPIYRTILPKSLFTSSEEANEVWQKIMYYQNAAKEGNVLLEDKNKS